MEEERSSGVAAGVALALGLGVLAGLAWRRAERRRRRREAYGLCTAPLGAHLLVAMYEEPDPARMAEFTACLAHNLENPHIARVHLFDETRAEGATPRMSVLPHPKMERVLCGRRVRFDDFFDYARRVLPGETVIVANTDIFFDDTLCPLFDYPLDGRMLALSRWDERADGSCALFEEPGSQDAWVFRAPLPEPLRADWYLGVPGCDNRLAWEARAAGLEVLNPARTVRARHLHLSGRRNYTGADTLSGPMCGVSIDEL